MIKKVILVTLILLVIGGGVFFYFESQRKARVSTTLSARSQAFIDKKSRETGTQYRYRNVAEEGKVPQQSSDESVDDCFTFTIPFQVRMSRKDGKCSYYYQLSEPRGSIVVYQRNEPVTSPDQMDGIGMRRQSSHSYKEGLIPVNGKSFIVFQNTSVGNYEKTAYYYKGPGEYVVLTLVAYATEGVDAKFQAMLSSIAFQYH